MLQMCAPALILTTSLAAPELTHPDMAPASGVVWGVGLGAIVWAMLLYAVLIA